MMIFITLIASVTSAAYMGQQPSYYYPQQPQYQSQYYAPQSQYYPSSYYPTTAAAPTSHYPHYGGGPWEGKNPYTAGRFLKHLGRSVLFGKRYYKEDPYYSHPEHAPPPPPPRHREYEDDSSEDEEEYRYSRKLAKHQEKSEKRMQKMMQMMQMMNMMRASGKGAMGGMFMMYAMAPKWMRKVISSDPYMMMSFMNNNNSTMSFQNQGMMPFTNGAINGNMSYGNGMPFNYNAQMMMPHNPYYNNTMMSNGTMMPLHGMMPNTMPVNGMMTPNGMMMNNGMNGMMPNTMSGMNGGMMPMSYNNGMPMSYNNGMTSQFNALYNPTLASTFTSPLGAYQVPGCTPAQLQSLGLLDPNFSALNISSGNESCLPHLISYMRTRAMRRHLRMLEEMDGEDGCRPPSLMERMFGGYRRRCSEPPPNYYGNSSVSDMEQQMQMRQMQQQLMMLQQQQQLQNQLQPQQLSSPPAARSRWSRR